MACGSGPPRKLEVTVLDSLQTKVEDLYSQSITVYPNPFCSNLKISVPDGLVNDTKLTIYDLYGKAIIAAEFENGATEINLNLPEITGGLYVLEIKQGNSAFTTKLIKQ